MPPALKTPRVLPWQAVDHGNPELNPDSALFDYRILAEGDSWFTLGGLPTSNLLFSLRLPGEAVIVNCGTPGDTIRHMGEMAANPQLRQALSANFGSKWDALLVSGGGNDLIDRVGRILLPPARRPARRRRTARNYCDEAQVEALLEEVRAGYRHIVALRDAPGSPCPGTPLLTHSYDWVTPRPAAAQFVLAPLLGPWLEPALAAARVPEPEWNAVSDYLLRRLGQALRGLARALPNFHAVNTCGTLTRAAAGARGASNDWLNEIHPTARGYEKLARKLSPRLARLLER